MADGDLHEQIAQIESDIEQLAQTLEKCRKAILFSKVAIGAGAIWILAYLVGAIRFDPTMMIAAIAAVIGGVVFYGSNSSTSKEAAAAMKDAERLRAELIDRVDPRTICGGGIKSFPE
ncbi:MAG: hypothetical protein WCF75_24615 [Pseudolabrys sp.]